MTEHFPQFSTAVFKRLSEMSKHELYVVDGIDLYTSYLLAFPEGTNPIFRVNTEHDCSCCKNFIRNMGGLVSIQNGVKQSIWQCEGLPEPYATVAATLNDLVQQLPIRGVFRTKETRFGAEYTYDENHHRWDHFHGVVAARHRSAQPDTDRGAINTTQAVLKRGLTELNATALQTVLDLIDDNAIYRGAEFRKSVQEFYDLQRAYGTSPQAELHVWANVTNPVARFRNTAIGTLVQNLSEGMDVDRAVRAFESMVAPTNYKRTTAVITPRMVEQALTQLRELDLESAVQRRFARISDVSVNDVLFVDNRVRAAMKDDLRGMLMEAAAPAVSRNTNQITDIQIADFITQVVPKAREMHVQLKNHQLNNFVSLTAPVHADAGRLFRWHNQFAWSYDGEVADSIKQRVKRAGGNTNAALRVSLAWHNYDDLDIHVHGPEGHVYYGNRAGILDVDMHVGRGTTREPVENLSWSKPRNGEYVISVNQFSRRENTHVGFELEVECAGRVTQYAHVMELANGKTIKCMSFRMHNGEMQDFKILTNSLVGGEQPTMKWGVQTQTWVPVTTLMKSPNHWEQAGAVGAQHWFFMLENCVNPDQTRGIYNEFLRGDLEPHRKVFEVLGSKTKCVHTADQLSGVGFTAARNDQVLMQVSATNSNRTYNIKF
jgi:uncharacterized protein YfaP (DUF2135 family)